MAWAFEGGLEPRFIVLSILGYTEKQEGKDGVEVEEHVAHCLEMDLKGRGDTFEEAEQALEGMIQAQLSFAKQMNKPGLIYRPADSWYFVRFAELVADFLRSFPRRPTAGDFQAYHLPLPSVEDEVGEKYALL